MKEHRATRQALEQRLRKRQDDVDRLWSSAQQQSGLGADQYGPLAARIGRRLTWKLWAIAMQEALAVIEEMPDDPPEEGQVSNSPLCYMCKRRMIALVPDNGLDELLDSA